VRYEIHNPEQAKEDLKGALRILQRDGWTQGKFKCADGKFCVQGAILAAVGVQRIGPNGYDAAEADFYPKQKRFHDANKLLMNHLDLGYFQTSADWNDDADRTFEDVRAALTAASA